MNLYDSQDIDKGEVKFCAKCVISNKRPRIKFNKNNVCNACEYAEFKKTQIDWQQREDYLLKLLDNYRSKNNSFDCIVPCSGGKDGSYVAHILKDKYNMKPLTITWSPFIYTDIGRRNLDSFIASGFDNLLYSPNKQLYKKLSRIGFEFVGDNFLPFIYGQMNYALHLSIQKNIPLIFYGENAELEYGGTWKNIDKSFKDVDDYGDEYFKGVNIQKLINIGLENKIIDKKDIQDNPLLYFDFPSKKLMKSQNTQVHWFSYYKYWDPQENYYYATENTGFKPNDERTESTYSKYASIDDETDGVHYFLSLIKFGLGRCTSDAAHEIRDGHLTREEGVSLVKKFDTEIPKKSIKFFLDYIDKDEDYFWEVINNFRKQNSDIWSYDKTEWKLKYNIS